MKGKNPLLRIPVALVGGILGYALVNSMYEAGRNKSRLAMYDSAMSQAADNLNKKLPMMFDAETRLDKVAANPGKMTYFFSLPNQAKAEMDLSVLQNRLRQNIIVNYRTNSGMEMERTHNVIMDYQYKDKNGELLFEFAVSPKDF